MFRTFEWWETRAGDDLIEASMWSDGAVHEMYESKNDVDERLAMMKWAMRIGEGNILRAKPAPIRSFLMFAVFCTWLGANSGRKRTTMI